MSINNYRKFPIIEIEEIAEEMKNISNCFQNEQLLEKEKDKLLNKKVLQMSQLLYKTGHFTNGEDELYAS
mgnify:CR=1 FL=1